MSPTDWFTAHKGTAILVPGGGAGNDGQCVQAMDSYLHEVYNKPYIYTPGAIDVWYNALLDQYGFERIAPGGPILAGDFLFYDGIAPKPGGGFYGHVDIASRNGTYSDFWAYDSNWGGAAFNNSVGFPTLHEVHHADGYNKYITGYYRLKAGKGGESATFDQGDDDMPIPDQDNYYSRYHKSMNLIRGRDVDGAGFDRSEFQNNFVGHSDLSMLEAMSDDPEADRAHSWMNRGYIAERDNWEGQISQLGAALETVKGQLNAIQNKPPEVVNSIDAINQCAVTMDTTTMNPTSTSIGAKIITMIRSLLGMK